MLQLVRLGLVNLGKPYKFFIVLNQYLKNCSFLGDGCIRSGIAMHEFLHAIGFVHEQSRPDRDQHVKINFNHIETTQRHNFEKSKAGSITTHGTPYDLNSILHYGPKSFSKNGKDTITAIKGDASNLGQRNGFSPIDRVEVGKHYGCNKNGNIDPNKNPKIDDPNKNPKIDDPNKNPKIDPSKTVKIDQSKEAKDHQDCFCSYK